MGAAGVQGVDKAFKSTRSWSIMYTSSASVDIGAAINIDFITRIGRVHAARVAFTTARASN